jgi:DMSO/TMAO reductase YedYZ molybdopterin-dependent catalytic subunit
LVYLAGAVKPRNMVTERTIPVSRRDFLRAGASSGGLLLAGPIVWPFVAKAAAAEQAELDGGKQLTTVPFIDEGRPEMNTPIGEELDGRLFTDLSTIPLGDEVTPTELFYIRTRASKLLPAAKSWTVKIGGLVEDASRLSIEELRSQAKPMGHHLMECSGNARFAHFGLISVTKWSGVPLEDILAGAKAKPGANGVLISGFDQYQRESTSSIPGASWIFRAEDLKSAGAFLATEMNDQPLAPDHGAPVRLVVPGWYGCTCIKWVDSIILVDDSVEATSQMKEYAARTHQSGVPAAAKEYQPAVIDRAAMPIRVEKWLVKGEIKYRVVGILWGGKAPVKALQIRFNPEEEYVPVDHILEKQNDPWGFWTHVWSPKTAGTYSIRLMVKEPAVRTRRLDSGYYVRTVDISEV